MQNIAIIQQGTGRYLFSVPENVTLREGDRVKCSTRRGITDGIAFADSAWVDENVSQLIGKLTGAKFPLKSVVGKMEYQPFEKPQDKPAGDTPIKLYCVKDYGSYLNAGKIYEFRDGYISVDGDSPMHGHNYKTLEGIYRIHPQLKSVLFPLVERPAKIGEYVLALSDSKFRDRPGNLLRYKKGDILKCTDLPVGKPWAGKAVIYNGTVEIIEHDNYLVLDGYRPETEPEKEKEPEYWSGKVVCVATEDSWFTVGKMYEFVNGEIKDDEGDERPLFTEQRFKSVDEWNKAYGMPIAQFIEFKGEAHD